MLACPGLGWTHAASHPRTYRPHSLGHRTRHLATRSRLGRGERGDARAVLAASVERGSPSSTPPTSTATAAARASSAPSSPTTPVPRSPSPPRWAAGSTSCPRTTCWRTSVHGPTARGANLRVDTLDLVQLHCPPSAVFTSDEVYDALDTLVADGAIANYGVSVETTAQALDRDRPAGHRDSADHPQRLPAEAARRGASRRAGGRRRHHRARAAGLRPAQRQVHPRHHVRGGRSPQLQPRRFGVRRRGDLLRRAVRDRPRGRARVRRAGAGRACPSPRLRWPGSPSSPA